jgi:hypothetical protein
MNYKELEIITRIQLLQSRKTENSRIIKKLERKLAKIRGERK